MQDETDVWSKSNCKQCRTEIKVPLKRNKLEYFCGMCLSAEEATVPCELCNKPTNMTGTARCHYCWELETRLKNPIHLKSLASTPAGRHLLQETIKNMKQAVFAAGV